MPHPLAAPGGPLPRGIIRVHPFPSHPLPGITAVELLGLIAAGAIFVGIAEIVAAVRLRKEITNDWLLVVSGLLAVELGILLIARHGLAEAALRTR